MFHVQGGVRVVTINASKEKDKGTVLENEDRSDIVVEDIDMEEVWLYFSVLDKCSYVTDSFVQASASLCHKGRMLPVTDHSKIYYRPFRKDFYVEVCFVFITIFSSKKRRCYKLSHMYVRKGRRH